MKPFSTLPAMVQHIVDSFRSSYAFNYRTDGDWEHMSTEIFVESIRRLSLGLHSLGLRKGETVGIIARSSPYWLIVDLAAMTAGGVSVPIFSHFSEANFRHIVKDSNMKILFVIEKDQWAAVSGYQELFQRVVTFGVDVQHEGEHVIDFEDVLCRGDECSKRDPRLYSHLRDSVKKDDLATIVYTGGRSGVPRGVELTQGNFISQVMASKVCFSMNPATDRVLSILPLAHVFGRMLMYHYISDGVPVYFVDDIRNLTAFLQDVKPTHTALVPLILEKFYGRIKMAMTTLPWFWRLGAQWFFKVAHKAPKIHWWHPLRGVLNKLIFRKVRKALGGELKVVIVGGAPLDAKLCQFFLNAGIPVFQGYGLTEACPVLSANFPDNNRPGTVGKPFPGVELKISPEGEILAKGPNIMRGYHGGAKATTVSIDKEGWLHTGDLGHIDSHGFLTVTGRIREIFKTSGGKMVSPIPIEQALCRVPFIDVAVVIADSRRFVSCLLFPNFEELERLRRKAQQEHLSYDDFVDTPVMKKEVTAAIHRVNKTLNEWEKIRMYRFVIDELSMEKGELTPTLKVDREVIGTKYQQLIDSMY